MSHRHRHRTPVLCSLALILLVVGCSRSAPPSDLTEVDAAQVPWTQVLTGASDAQGRHLAAVVESSTDPAYFRVRRLLYLYDAQTHRARFVPGWHMASGLSFSPDGNRLAFIAEPVWKPQLEHYLVLVDLNANRQTHAFLRQKVTFIRTYWSPDSALVAAAGFRRGTGPKKGVLQHFVWVGDPNGTRVAWHSLPAGLQETSWSFGWSRSNHTLVGLNSKSSSSDPARPPGIYLWSLQAQSETPNFSRLAVGPVETSFLFYDSKRFGDYIYIAVATAESAQGQGLKMAYVDMAKATISPFPNARAWEGRWTASPDGQWVAMIDRGRASSLALYRRDGTTRTFPLPPRSRRGSTAAWLGPGPQEVTVATASAAQPFVVLNVNTGDQRPVFPPTD